MTQRLEIHETESVDLLPRLGLGAAAGLAGTAVLQRSMAAGKRIAPGTQAPLRRDPAAEVIDRVKERVPAGAVEPAARHALAMVYGATAGVLYSLLRPRGGSPVRDGIALGAGVWAAGYLGWLPKMDLIPAVKDQSIGQVAGPIVHHAIYGLATVTGFRLASHLLGGSIVRVARPAGD